MALTAHHILNKEELRPNNGFSCCQFWLLLPHNNIIELNADYLEEFADIDLTLIKLPNHFIQEVYRVSEKIPTVGTKCRNIGFRGNEMPSIDAEWRSDRLLINSFNLDQSRVEAKGMVKSLKNMTVNTLDIKMQNVCGIETSYGGVVGMSGGPLINAETGEVIGSMSIGLPPDEITKKTLFAISMSEISRKIDKAQSHS